MKKIIMLIFILIVSNVYAQYNQQWVNRLNGSANRFDIANNMYLDEQSNVFVYSTISNSKSTTDISAIKYSPLGNILWQYVYSSPGIDQLQDVYKDEENYSYITGYTSVIDELKILTIKLSPSGTVVWSRTYSATNYTSLISQSIITDSAGNIYVLLDGRNISTSFINCVLIKYDQSGNLVSQVLFEGSSTGDNHGVKLIEDSFGNIFAGVNSVFASFGFDILIYKLNNNLNEIYSKRISGAANSDDGIVDMKLSGDNNLLLTAKITNAGNTSDIGTFKINNSNGDILWQNSYNGSGNNIDLPYSIATDNQNNVLVTGFIRNSNNSGSEDIVTLKYGANGNLLWSKIYNDSTNGIDQGFSICSDAQNNVYVGGTADYGNLRNGYITIKYDALGNLLWKGVYRFITLSEDFVYKIAVNNSQDIFLTGISFSDSTDYDVTTIKYASQTGIYSNPEYVSDFKLYVNYPNPFNPSTKIRFYNPQRNFITVKIFDLKGTEIALLENKTLAEGNYEYEFRPENLSSGVYFYRVYYGDNYKTGKMILSK